MSLRKLTALGHINPSSVNINDGESLKTLVVWLEDQKIRHYKIEDRKFLKEGNPKPWKQSFQTYLKDLSCPLDSSDISGVVDWLLGLAVQLEYEENVQKFKNETASEVKKRKSEPTMVKTNPLDDMDFESEDFKEGINGLADLLKINPHPDHLVTLKALSILISTRLSEEALKNPGSVIPVGKPYPIEKADLGFETGDPVLNNAAKMLRLLYIHDLRNLQTRINECIVACQETTANPKTDTKIGKVGY